jgi:AAA domain/CHC2 zinc finger
MLEVNHEPLWLHRCPAETHMNSNPFHPEQVRRYFETRLPNYKWNGRPQTSARCPFHDDSTASFSINSDEGVWACHAGCGSGGILDFEQKLLDCDHGTAKSNVATLLGMTFGPEPEATYIYRDALRKVVFRKLRYPGKTFVCQRPAANGKGWVNGLDGIQIKPLYHLPEVIRATYVICVEGEKDADRLTVENLSQFSPDGLPVAVTCNFDGAAPGHWRPEYAVYFAGKQVTIFPDNDQTGQEHALDCARGIYPLAAGVKIVSLPGLPEHGDVSDYLDAGHCAEDLIAEIANAPQWRPDAAESSRFRSVVEIRAKGSEKPDWILSRYVERTGLTSMSAKIKTGKSSLITSGIKAIINGTPFLGEPVTRGPVVLVSEMSGAAFIAALERAAIQDCEGLRVLQPHDAFGLTWPQTMAAAVEECKRVNAVLLVVDTLNWFAGLMGDDENSAGKMLESMRPLQAATGKGWGVLFAVHERKSGGSVEDAARGSSAVGGVADVLMSLRRPEGNHHSDTTRKISSISRFPQTPGELVIDWTADGEYTVLGNSDAVTRDRATQAITAALPFFADSAKTVVVLVEETGETRATIRRVLRELKAIRIGTGDKGDPFKYWRKVGGQ